MTTADGDLSAELDKLQKGYELLGELSRDEIITVYVARDRLSGNEVAIKVLLAKDARGREGLAHYASDARLLTALEHPNIVNVHAVKWLSENVVAVIAERVHGPTLRQVLDVAGTLPVTRATEVLKGLGRALAWAHSSQIMHRDVRPENVIFEDGTGRVVLTDLGLARRVDAATGAGDDSYRAPELADGRYPDQRTDVYSVGVVGWELLTGRRPWPDNVSLIQPGEPAPAPPPLAVVRPGLPPALVSAIEGAVQLDRDRRIPDVTTFLDRLTGIAPPPRRPIEDEDQDVDVEPSEWVSLPMPRLPSRPAAARGTPAADRDVEREVERPVERDVGPMQPSEAEGRDVEAPPATAGDVAPEPAGQRAGSQSRDARRQKVDPPKPTVEEGTGQPEPEAHTGLASRPAVGGDAPATRATEREREIARGGDRDVTRPAQPLSRPGQFRDLAAGTGAPAEAPRPDVGASPGGVPAPVPADSKRRRGRRAQTDAQAGPAAPSAPDTPGARIETPPTAPIAQPQRPAAASPTPSGRQEARPDVEPAGVPTADQAGPTPVAKPASPPTQAAPGHSEQPRDDSSGTTRRPELKRDRSEPVTREEDATGTTQAAATVLGGAAAGTAGAPAAPETTRPRTGGEPGAPGLSEASEELMWPPPEPIADEPLRGPIHGPVKGVARGPLGVPVGVPPMRTDRMRGGLAMPRQGWGADPRAGADTSDVHRTLDPVFDTPAEFPLPPMPDPRPMPVGVGGGAAGSGRWTRRRIGIAAVMIAFLVAAGIGIAMMSRGSDTTAGLMEPELPEGYGGDIEVNQPPVDSAQLTVPAESARGGSGAGSRAGSGAAPATRSGGAAGSRSPPAARPETPSSAGRTSSRANGGRTAAASPPATPRTAVAPARSPAVVPARTREERADGFGRCSSPAMVDQRACIAAHLARSDAGLNQVYNDLIAAMRQRAGTATGDPDPPEVQRLRATQRSWLVRRDAECRRRGRGREGPLWAPQRAQCLEEFSVARSRELSSTLARLRD